MRGVTAFEMDFFLQDEISTHTPHARRDTRRMGSTPWLMMISTHTPHARRDKDVKSFGDSIENFYSHASCEA